MNDVFSQYAALTAQIKELQDAQKALLATITEEVARQDGKVKTEAGVFSMVVRKVFSYSDAVTSLESEYKTLKKQEEQEGVASFTEASSIRFTPVKVK